ncbi:hypothetical protein Tco_0031593 [Tanacetum coccineum]
MTTSWQWVWCKPVHILRYHGNGISKGGSKYQGVIWSFETFSNSTYWWHKEQNVIPRGVAWSNVSTIEKSELSLDYFKKVAPATPTSNRPVLRSAARGSSNSRSFQTRVRTEVPCENSSRSDNVVVDGLTSIDWLSGKSGKYRYMLMLEMLVAESVGGVSDCKELLKTYCLLRDSMMFGLLICWDVGFGLVGEFDSMDHWESMKDVVSDRPGGFAIRHFMGSRRVFTFVVIASFIVSIVIGLIRIIATGVCILERPILNDGDSPKNVNNDSVSPSSRVLREEDVRGVESDLVDSFEEGEIRDDLVLYNDGCIKDCMEKNLEDDAGEILGVHSQGGFFEKTLLVLLPLMIMRMLRKLLLLKKTPFYCASIFHPG